MSALIPIMQREGKPAVSARELYRFLELLPSDYARWARANIIINPFATKFEDWDVLSTSAENPQGGRPSQDYALALPFAKKLAMMSRSARAEQVRDYFIECERRALAVPTGPDFSDPLTTARLFIEAETGRREAERQLEVQAPAVAFARQVEMSEADISVGAFAKAIGWGPNTLHSELRRRGFTFRLDGHPMPKQAFIAQGLFRVKEVPSGRRVFPVMAITGKGQLRLAAVLGITAQLQMLAAPAA